MKKIVLFSFFLVLLLFSCECSEKEPLSEENKDFAGRWVARDDNWVRISLQGGGSFKMDNSSIDGGHTKIENDQLEIGLFGLKKTWTITRRPYQKEDGTFAIELDGIEYRKE